MLLEFLSAKFSKNFIFYLDISLNCNVRSQSWALSSARLAEENRRLCDLYEAAFEEDKVNNLTELKDKQSGQSMPSYTIIQQQHG